MLFEYLAIKLKDHKHYQNVYFLLYFLILIFYQQMFKCRVKNRAYSYRFRKIYVHTLKKNYLETLLHFKFKFEKLNKLK